MGGRSGRKDGGRVAGWRGGGGWCRTLCHTTTLPLYLLVFIACSGGSQTGSAAVTIDTLGNGAVVVHNPEHGLWDSASAWRIVPDLTIGRAEGSGPETFGQVGAVAADRAGRIYVLDRQSQEVRVFDSAGAFMRTIGRQGAGPGEFRGANGLALDRDGRLWVTDERLGRYDVFDTAGNVVATYPRTTGSRGWTPSGRFVTSGERYDLVDLMWRGHYAMALAHYDTTAKGFVDTLVPPSPPTPPLFYEFRDASGIGTMASVPYQANAVLRIGPRGNVWGGPIDGYRLLELNHRWDTVRVVEREYAPVPVTATERDSAIAGLVKLARGHKVDGSLIPSTKPPFQTFIVADDGSLWVFPTPVVGAHETPMDVFDRIGRFLGTLTIPGSVAYRLAAHPLVVRDGHAYAL